jgi:hypothetical protein
MSLICNGYCFEPCESAHSFRALVTSGRYDPTSCAEVFSATLFLYTNFNRNATADISSRHRHFGSPNSTGADIGSRHRLVLRPTVAADTDISSVLTVLGQTLAADTDSYCGRQWQQTDISSVLILLQPTLATDTDISSVLIILRPTLATETDISSVLIVLRPISVLRCSVRFLIKRYLRHQDVSCCNIRGDALQCNTNLSFSQ